MIAELDTIKREIMPQIISKGIDRNEKDVLVEADKDLDGFDFIRVQIRLPKRELADKTLEELLELIEDSVSKVDDRYVSVRFEEAA